MPEVHPHTLFAPRQPASTIPRTAILQRIFADGRYGFDPPVLQRDRRRVNAFRYRIAASVMSHRSMMDVFDIRTGNMTRLEQVRSVSGGHLTGVNDPAIITGRPWH